MLQAKTLFALGKQRATSEGVEYTIYTVKDAGDKAFRVDGKIGMYKVPSSLNEKYGDLTLKDVDTDAFGEIGDMAIQAAEIAKPEKEKSKTGKKPKGLEKLDVVVIPGLGDCFFQSVAYCILADDSFLDSNKNEDPWKSEADLKATEEQRSDPMEASGKWIAPLRKRVADHATTEMYLHARTMALQTLDRREYLKLANQAETTKKSETPGSVYEDDGHWYFVHEDGAAEQLAKSPYPKDWKGSKSDEAWVAQQETDLTEKEKDADGAGEIAGHRRFLKKCKTFAKFQAFIKTSDYWADDYAIEILAQRLRLNILIADIGYGVNSTTGDVSSEMTLILQRTGQHFNAMFKKGTSKYVMRTDGPIVSGLKGKRGGGDDSTDKEETEEPGKDDTPITDPETEKDSADEETEPAQTETDETKTPDQDTKKDETSDSETSPDTPSTEEKVESDEKKEKEDSSTSEESKDSSTAESKDSSASESKDSSEATPTPMPKTEGGKKQSKKRKPPPRKVSKRVQVLTDVPF